MIVTRGTICWGEFTERLNRCFDFDPEKMPLEKLIIENRKNGERVISQLRLLVLLLLVPAFAMRIYKGEFLREYILFTSLKLSLIFLVYLWIDQVLKKGHYNEAIGYILIALDTIFLSFCIVTLSFCKPFHEGVLTDPLIVGYFLVGVSSSLRFDFRYLFFGIFFCVAAIFIIALSDFFFHGLLPDQTLIGDVVLSLVGISLATGYFIRKLRDILIKDCRSMKKQVGEIASILDICRHLSSRKEIEKTVKKILDETVTLLQADFGVILVENGSPGHFEHFASRGAINRGLKESVISIDNDFLVNQILFQEEVIYPGIGLAIPPVRKGLMALLMEKEQVESFMALSLHVDGEKKGVFIAGNRHQRCYPDYEKMLATILLEQVSISARIVTLLKRLENQEPSIYETNGKPSSFQNMIGQSEEMVKLYEMIGRAAKASIPVLIRGESGTGKELAANALKNLSDRREGPFIKINCAAIPEELLESELFGHEKGAFTGAVRQKKGKIELADGGTLFLDEIGDMPLHLQAKLLRVLQDNRFERVGGGGDITSDFRLITATNQHIEEQIKKGLFRQDLYYRINGIPIHLPSLRSRKSDIPLLAEHFLSRCGDTTGVKKRLTQTAMDRLVSMDWLGNIRELEHVIYRLVTMTGHDPISETDIQEILTFAENPFLPSGKTGMIMEYISQSIQNGGRFQDEISAFEKYYIEHALLKNDGNISKAGRMIGLPKTTLYNKMKKYQLN